MPDVKHCSLLLFSLNFAADIARDFLIPVPEEWVDCAKKIKVPFDAEKKYHPEYDGYSPGERRGSSRALNWPLLCFVSLQEVGTLTFSKRGTVAEWLAEVKISSVALPSAAFGLPV